MSSMFAIITKDSIGMYDLLKHRFKSVRGETFADNIDIQREDVGYVCVSEFPTIILRVSKTSEAMKSWWEENGKESTGVKKCPYPYLVETADEMFSIKNGAYNPNKIYGDEIGGLSIEDIGIRTQEHIEELKKSISVI